MANLQLSKGTATELRSVFLSKRVKDLEKQNAKLKKRLEKFQEQTQTGLNQQIKALLESQGVTESVVLWTDRNNYDWFYIGGFVDAISLVRHIQSGDYPSMMINLKNISYRLGECLTARP